MKLTSIVYGGRTIARRPSQYDEAVLSDVFDAILPELAAECCWDIEKDADTINEARQEFINAESTDGYKIMRHFDMCLGWDGDARCVEIFDDAPFQRCLAGHVQRWIDYFKIEPLFKEGDTVAFMNGREEMHGVVEEVTWGEPGRYTIRVEGMVGKPVVRWELCKPKKVPQSD